MPKSLVLIFVIPLLLTSCGGVEDTEEYKQGHEEGFNEGADWICDQWERSLPSQIYAQYEPRGC